MLQKGSLRAISRSGTAKGPAVSQQRNQAVRIPVEFELPADEAIISRDGDRIIIEPIRRSTLLEFVRSWGPLDAEFPDVDEDLLLLRDVTL